MSDLRIHPPTDTAGAPSAPDCPRVNRIGEEAAEWQDKLETDRECDQAAFGDWLATSARHVDCFIRACEAHQALVELGRQGAFSKAMLTQVAGSEPVANISRVVVEVGNSALKSMTSPSDTDPLPGDVEPVRATKYAHRLPTKPSDDAADHFMKCRQALRLYFYRTTRSFQAAEDITQDVFVRFLASPARKEVRPERVRAYLFKIAQHVAMDWWRRERRQRFYSGDDSLSELVDPSSLPAESIESQQLTYRVRLLLHQLPVAADRELLRQFYLHEEPPDSLRQSMKLTEVQFNQVLWRARQRFGDILRQHGLAMVEEPVKKPPAGPVIAQSDKEVFIAYAHRDRPILEGLHDQLDLLRRGGHIRAWHDREIAGGTLRENESVRQLDRSRLLLSLVSSDYLESGYCYGAEMTRAVNLTRSGQLSIVPILVDECDWLSSPLRPFKPLPGDERPIAAWGNAQEAFRVICAGLRERLG